MKNRFAVIAALVALALVCLTVLAAMQVVDGDRVLDMIVVALPSFLGGLLGGKNGNGKSLRPPPAVVAPYPGGRA